jgi:hypothetical protein
MRGVQSPRIEYYLRRRELDKDIVQISLLIERRGCGGTIG